MKNAYRFVFGLLALTLASWANADVVNVPAEGAGSIDAATIVAPMSPDTTVWVQNTFGNEIELYSGTTPSVPSGSQGLIIGGTENTAQIKVITNCLQNLGQTTVMNNGTLTVSGSDGTADYFDKNLTISGGSVLVKKSVYSMRNGANVTISGGSLEFLGKFRVGYDSAATFDQTDGTVTPSSGILSIGYKNGSNGKYNLSGGTLTSSQEIRIGEQNGSVGILDISSTGTVSATANISIGVESGATGTLKMTGGTVNASSNIYIGLNSGSTGTLDMAGGTVNSSTSLRVGSSGSGTFNLSNGEFIESAGWINLGYEASGKGVMTVNGGTLTYTSNDLRVGRAGEGLLKLESGTINLGSKALVMGYYEGSTGEFTMSGGTLTANALTLGDKVATETKPGAKGTATFTNGVTQNFPGNIVVANYGTGTLTVDNATLNTSGYVYIGYKAGGNGEVILKNGGTLAPTSHSVRVGEAGTGALTIESNALYTGNEIYVGSGATGVGTFTVDGGNVQSKRIIVGDAGTGTMNTSNNASITVVSGGFCIGGNESDAKNTGTGTVTLTDTTLDIMSDLSVGNYGTGTMTLEGTTNVTMHDDGNSTGYLYMGRHTGSTGTLNLQNGGAMTITDHASRIGLSGTATVNVLTGGVFESTGRDIHLGYNASGDGTFIIDSGTVNTAAVVAGNSGTGKLEVKSGTLNATSHLYAGNSAGSTGTIDISGGTVTAGDLRVGENGTGVSNISGGTVTFNTIMYAGLYNQGTINITEGADVTVKGNIIAGYQTVPTEENPIKGTLNISGGTVKTNSSILVGNKANANGELNVSGGTLTAASELRVGDSGNGVMNVTGGETTVSGLSNIAYAAGSTGKLSIENGTVNLTNSGGTFRIGRYGEGTVEVLDGGLLSVPNNETDLGYYADSKGTLTIDGGTAQIQTLMIGHAAGATGNFNLLDGTLTITKTEINVGENGTGYATISGGVANATSLRVGRNNGSVGELTIDGDGVLNLSSAARISYSAGSQGSVYIKENGQMNVTKELTIGSADVGYVEVSGGELNANPIIVKDNGSSMKITGGTVTTPALTTANSLTWTGGTLDAKAVTGDLTQNGGTYNPGDLQIVDATINGNYTQSGDGTIVIDFNADNTDWDTITVNNGNINLGGTLFLNITNELNTLDTYPIFSVNGGNMDVTGMSVAFPEWYTGNPWMINSAGILELGALPPGPVDPSVPEPATWVLMLLGFAGLLYSRKRSRK
ncbi:MAG: PEP-CTERM sorting domain-containing protein [Thermoguttaceae bacterium]|nr:PEP-CTERM sorting domain-containing protein [Thermoguttaceae bacterium]